jgi:CDP-diacylglycerol--serine O-phosphatidyltransferase
MDILPTNNQMPKRYLNTATILTFIALAFAWAAIILLLNDKFYLSWFLALLAFIFDTFDGWVARKFDQVSEFGRQLDGQVDVFIYLIYPGLVFYLFFGLDSFISLAIIFLFICAGIFRLLRFNLQGYKEQSGDKKFYVGFPVVFSHLLILIFLLFKFLSFSSFSLIADILLLTLSLLMVTKVPVYKPKNIFWLVFGLACLALLSLALYYYGYSSISGK